MVNKGYLLGLMINNGYNRPYIFVGTSNLGTSKSRHSESLVPSPSFFPREIARFGRLVRTQVVSISIFREVMIVG